MTTLFFSYSHLDEDLRDRLEKQLAMLKRQGIIQTWHDRRIGAGMNIDLAIDARIETDDIILLLISPDFIASDYCYESEMKRAMERHERGEAIVIPVILRACDWHHAPFGKLNAVPRDGKPITRWPDIDEAMLQVAQAVREAAARSVGPPASTEIRPVREIPAVRPAHALGPRSSNLRLAKTFSQRDKDRFRADTFDFMARFFENSLDELGKRNGGIEGVFERLDSSRFFATVYRNGAIVAQGTVYVGRDHWSSGICYVNGQSTTGSAMNECLTVDSDDQALFFRSMGMASFGGERDQRLSADGAAELFWSILISPLQNRR